MKDGTARAYFARVRAFLDTEVHDPNQIESGRDVCRFLSGAHMVALLQHIVRFLAFPFFMIKQDAASS